MPVSPKTFEAARRYIFLQGAVWGARLLQEHRVRLFSRLPAAELERLAALDAHPSSDTEIEIPSKKNSGVV